MDHQTDQQRPSTFIGRVGSAIRSETAKALGTLGLLASVGGAGSAFLGYMSALQDERRVVFETASIAAKAVASDIGAQLNSADWSAVADFAKFTAAETAQRAAVNAGVIGFVGTAVAVSLMAYAVAKIGQPHDHGASPGASITDLKAGKSALGNLKAKLSSRRQAATPSASPRLTM